MRKTLSTLISHSRSNLGIQFQKLPKVELHRHLEGSVRLTTVLDEAIKHNVSLPHGQNGDLTPAAQLTLEGIRPHIQSIRPFPNLETLLDIFNHTQSTFVHLDVFHRIAKEAVLDAHEEGIRLIELRYAPTFASMPPNAHAFEDVLEAIEDGIEDAQHMLGKDVIAVGLICIGVGAMGPEAMKLTADFYINNKNRFIGFDMAGAESNVLEHQIEFQKVKDAGGRITCHASEDLIEGIPENALNAVQKLHAERIGHGIQTYKDKKVMNVLRDRNIMLEVSVSSNWLTAGVDKLENHPVKNLWEHGIPVCPNTDDPGIMGIDLNHEWHIWRDTLGFSEEDMSAMTLLALDRSFVSEMTKNKIYDLHFSTLEPPNEDGEYTIETAVKWAESHHKSVVDRARERKIQAMYASVKNICLETE
tara:strand:+ start:95 stop:1345 length:1251 start_codon:yes stop_codon:yes gene_type:complete